VSDSPELNELTGYFRSKRTFCHFLCEIRRISGFPENPQAKQTAGRPYPAAAQEGNGRIAHFLHPEQTGKSEVMLQ
jgi:hypothetical protein